MRMGKLIAILGILVVGLLCYTVKSNAGQVSRCSYKESGVDVYQLYSDLVTHQFREMSEDQQKKASFSDVMKSMPKVQFFRNESTFAYPDITKSDILLEGFFRADLNKDDYILVPGLGLGIDVSKYDVIYFCVEFTPKETDRRVTILTMTPTLSSRNKFFGWLSDNYHGDLSDKLFVRKLVSLNINPISSSANLIQKIVDHIPLVNNVYSKINHSIIQKGAQLVDFAWLMLRKWTIDAGVYELEVRPKEMNMMYQVKVLNAVGFKSKLRTIKRGTPVLQDKYYEEISEVIVNQP